MARRTLRNEGATLDEPKEDTYKRFVYQRYTGRESLPEYDPKKSNSFDYSRFLVKGYKNSTMKLIRIYRDESGIRREHIASFKPLNNPDPKNTAAYEKSKRDKEMYRTLKQDGVITGD